jgi:hypothetical protein
VGIRLPITLGPLLKVYSLLNVKDFTSQMRIVVNIIGYFLTGVDDSGVVSIAEL